MPAPLTLLFALFGCAEPPACGPGLARTGGYCLAPDGDGGGTGADPADPAADPGGSTDTGEGGAATDAPAGMVRVPATGATLGCTDADPSCHTPLQWEATLTHDLFVDRTEVTRAAWEALLGARAWPDDCGADCPASGLTWHEAAALANARSAAEGLGSCYTCGEDAGGRVTCAPDGLPTRCPGYRLPTEAEWELAARCGEDHAFSGSARVDAVAWVEHNSGGRLHAVAGLAPNACGLHDMSGNAWEWTQDWYLPDLALVGGEDPLGGFDGEERVARGGAHDFDQLTAAVHFRDRCRRPDMAMPNLGVRLVRTAADPDHRPAPGEMVWLDAGSFTLGCTAGQTDCAADEAAHGVTLTRGFWIDVGETTQAEHARLTGETPAQFRECGEACPVEMVSWHQAAWATTARSAEAGLSACYTCSGSGLDLRCAAVDDLLACPGYRLPTEAEWEVAARCGTDHPFPGGPSPTWTAWVRETAGETPHPVGQLRANACGLLDMGGNVAEWVHDGHARDRAGGTDPVGDPAATGRVTRGGGWVSDPTQARVPARRGRDPTQVSSATGYRMVRGPG